MVGDAMREPGADVLDAEPADQELGELDNPGAELGKRGIEPGVFVAHGGHAGRRRANDDLRAREDLREAAREHKRLGPVPSVEMHLAAARLRLREVDLVPEPLEQTDDRDSSLRTERVVQARDEECDTHGP
jgi:hypothetical protein